MKVCVVLGAGAGIGYAVAQKFASRGYHIALCARQVEKLETLKDTLENASVHALDVSDYEALTNTIQNIEAQIGEVDVLVYNAYSLSAGRASNLKAEKLENSLRINVTGALTAASTAAQLMVKRERGTILFTGGGFALYPEAKLTALSMGKAALRSLAFCLHDELKTKNIHVGTVTVCGTVARGSEFDPDLIAEKFLELHDQPTGEFKPEILFEGKAA